MKRQIQSLSVAGFGLTNFYKQHKVTNERVDFEVNQTARFLKETVMRDSSDRALDCRIDATKLCVDSIVEGESICSGDSGK